MSKSPESDLMNNLSAMEKRRLMRHIAEGSPKKTAQNEPTTTRNYNQTPKPFNAKVPPSTSASRYKPPVKANSFVSGKVVNTSNNNVVVPKLNQANVEMFMSKENGAKPRPKPNVRNITPVPYKPVSKFIPKNDNSTKSVISKVNEPKPKISSSRPLVTSSSVSNKPNFEPSSVKNKPNFEPSSVKDKAQVAPRKFTNVSKPTPNPKPVENKVSKSPASRPTSANSQHSPSHPPRKSKPPTAVITPIVKTSTKQSSSKKTSSKKPPTAVIAPIVKPTAPVKQKSTDSSKKNELKTRQRSVSDAPVPKKTEPKDIAVSYNAAGDNVNIPVAAQLEKTRSHSDNTHSSDIVPLSGKASATVLLNLGHNFQPHELKDWVNWCDACGSVILSLFGKCVSCTKCKMVCHVKCTLTVSLTCEADQPPPPSDEAEDLPPTRNKTIVEETKDEATLKEYNTIQRVISVDEIQQRIEDFNVTVKGSQQMTLQEDGETFRGFIRVSMNLTRPVCVQDSSKTSRKPIARKSSFYIDKGALKALHLTSSTTAEQVVHALLHKYSISDNPMKFALFEKQMREEGHVILRKMLPKERPLFLRLLWGNGDCDKRGFILQENESRDIHWESFSVGELHMFIKILDKEEADYVLEIKRKFKNKAQDIKNAIQYHNKKNKEGK